MNRTTRVTGLMDVQRLAAAVSRPGIDPRQWQCLAVVIDKNVDPSHGPLVDVTLLPFGEPATARVGSEYAGQGFGAYFPVQVDDEVLVGFPDGDADNGLVVLRRLYSPSDPPPPEAVSNPEDCVIHVKAGQKISIVVESGGTVELGGFNLEGDDGVVTGRYHDQTTGLRLAITGEQSSVVKGRQS